VIRRALGALGVATVVAVGALATAPPAAAAPPATQRYEGPLFSFDYPAGSTVKPGADASADVAVAIRDGAGIITAVVLAGNKRIGDADVEPTATAWHAARMKNRAAWGVKADGGPPRDSVRIGDRRWTRWRDRVGSVLGAQEQTMTCGNVGGHLSCVVVSAPLDKRDAADTLAAQLLGSLDIRRR
jgi:hypothetical protein